MLVGKRSELFYRVPDRPRIRVEQQEIAPRGEAHPRVVAAAHPAVLLFDHARVGKAAPHDLQRLVLRPVVDDDRLVASDALEATLDPLRRIESYDYDGNV